MDNQHKQRLSSGHEGHGGHVCQKCGWPFPNKHPSARHRRAHKRICGTVEGYKLIDWEENKNLTVLDNDHHADDDPKIPSLERFAYQTGTGALSGRSNRSEDDVFSDAPADFSDTVVNPGVEEHLENARKSPGVEGKRIIEGDSDSSLFVKDGAIADIIQQPSHLLNTEINIPELLGSTTDQLGNKEQSQDYAVIPGSKVKVDASRGIAVTRSADTVEVGRDKKIEHDVPLGQDPVVTVEEFKDHEGLKLNQLETLDICRINKDMGENFRYSIDFEEDNFGLGTEISSPYVNDLEDNLKLESGSGKVIVDELPVQAYAEVPQVRVVISEKKGSYELGASSDTEVIGLEKSLHSPGGDLQDNCNNVPKVNLEKNVTCAPIDVAVEENCTDTAITDAASSNACEPKVDSKTSLLDSDNIGEHGQQEVEKVHEACANDVTRLAKSSQGRVFESLRQAPESHKTSEDKMSKEPLLLSLEPTNRDSTADDVTLAAKSFQGGVFESLRQALESHKTSEDQMSKEPLLPSLGPSNQDTAVDKNDARGIGNGAIRTNCASKQAEGDDNFVKPQHGASAVDCSIDSISQTDSLEGHWGSVSVLSTQSDIPPTGDAAVLPSNVSQSSLEEKDGTKISKVEEQHPDKSESFEPSSFVTLVEPRNNGDQKGDASNVEKVQNQPQSESAKVQAGRFPYLTHVVNDSQGRKKNEEIIAKVTNWSTGNERASLKSLLVEETLEQKQVPEKNPNPDIIPSTTTVNSILGPESPTNEAAKGEIEKEWNSSARYSSEIKSEKRKVKGRPYWAQFMCCSSSLN